MQARTRPGPCLLACAALAAAAPDTSALLFVQRESYPYFYTHEGRQYVETGVGVTQLLTTQGDTDLDGDIDNTDLGTMLANFTGDDPAGYRDIDLFPDPPEPDPDSPLIFPIVRPDSYFGYYGGRGMTPDDGDFDLDGDVDNSDIHLALAHFSGPGGVQPPQPPVTPSIVVESAAVPEPAAAMGLLIGGGLALRRRR